MLERPDALRLIDAAFPEQPVVLTLGGTIREMLAVVGRKANHLYCLDSMGQPLAIGLGLAALVAAAGVVVRKPLARVPENTLKYAVGIILTSLGTFWAAEGMGATWPLDFVSIFFLAAAYFGASQLAVMLSHRRVFA